MLSECEHFRHALNFNPDVAEAVLESAIELAWIMSSLLPPSSACEPTVYYKEWQELVTTSESLGSTVNPETDTDYKLVYCRPVLFFGAEGTVGKPGTIKCLLEEPLLLQTSGGEASNGEQPPPSRLDSRSNENRLEEPDSSHKVVETCHKESTAFTAVAKDTILSSPSEAAKTSSHVSTTDEQNETTVLTSPLDDEGSDGANCNFRTTCKTTIEEVGIKSENKATQPVSDKGEQATNLIENGETLSCTEKKYKAYDQISTDYMLEKEQQLGTQNSDVTQSSDLSTVEFDQQFDVMLNPQKLSPANLNTGGCQENLITAQQPSDALSAAEQETPFKVAFSLSQTSNPAAYAQLSSIADSKSTATNATDKGNSHFAIRSTTVHPPASQTIDPDSEF